MEKEKTDKNQNKFCNPTNCENKTKTKKGKIKSKIKPWPSAVVNTVRAASVANIKFSGSSLVQKVLFLSTKVNKRIYNAQVHRRYNACAASKLLIIMYSAT